MSTEEETKKAYLDQDTKLMSKKIREAMLQIVLNDGPDTDYKLYKHIMDNFSKGELAHISAVYIAKKLADDIHTKPEILKLLQSIKMIDDIQKKVKSEEEE